MAPPGRRRIVVAAALVAAVGGLVLLTRSGRSAAPARRAAAPPRAAPAVPDEPPAARPPAPDAVVAPGVRPPREKPALPPQALARSAADDYRRRARYPRWAHPLEPEEDPIARDRELTPIVQRGPNGEDPALTVFPALPGFEAPAPAVLLAFLSVGDARIAARDLRATVTTEALQPIAEVVYNDDGANGDQEAGDGLYTTLFVPPDDTTLAQSFLVQVQAIALGDVERRAATSFLYSRPHARLTGRYRDALVGGSLRVEAEVEVTTLGRFHLEATLADATGARQLAWAQAASVLPPGTHWMPLDYYGLILRDLAVDGPYLLRRVALSTATDMPNAKNRVAENAWLTAAYRAAAFTDRPYDDPSLREAADRLERDAHGLGRLDAGG